MYSITEALGTGSQMNVAVPPYLSREHITVYVDTLPTTAFEWINDQTISILAQANRTIKVVRRTSPDERLTRYLNGEALPGETLEVDSMQAFFLAQEAYDLALSAGGTGVGNITLNGVEMTTQGIMALLNGQITPSQLELTLREAIALNAAPSDVPGSILWHMLQESNARAAALLGEAEARTTALQAEANARVTAALAERNERVSAEGVLNSRIDTIAASTAGLNAAVTSEYTARVDQGVALGARIDTVEVSVAGNAASVTAETVARTNADNALASAVESVVATMEAGDAAVNARVDTVTQAYVDADAALSVRIDSMDAAYKAADTATNAALTTANTARADGDAALANTLALLDTAYKAADTTTTARIAAEETARASGDSSLASQITALDVAYKAADSTATARISAEETARASGDSANASAISSLDAAYKAGDSLLQANLDSVFTATANADAAIAASVTTLSTTLGNRVGAVEVAANTTTTRVDTVESNYTIKVQARADGKNAIAGIGLAATAGGAGPTQSEMVFLADKFTFVPSLTDVDFTPQPLLVGGLVNGVNTVVIPPSRLGDRLIESRMVLEGTLEAKHVKTNSITADKIDSRGLSIKDGAGNVILAAGSALDFGNFGNMVVNPPSSINNSAIVIGGRNTFISTQRSIEPSGGLSYVAVDAACPYGFQVTGDSDGVNNLRVANVIKGNGEWTVSWDMRGSQSVAVGVLADICDTGDTLFFTTADNTWKRFSLTVNVTNYGDGTTNNFVDFYNFAWAYFYFRNVKVEKGNKATDWTPAPEDVDAGIAAAQANAISTAAAAAQAKADLAETTAKAYADGKVTAEEARAIADATAKANTAQSAAIAAAAADATAKADAARGKSLAPPLEQWETTQGFVTVSDGKVGTSVLRITGSGSNTRTPGYYPIDPSKTYRTRFWARPSANNASGLLYFCLQQFVNNTGTPGPYNGGRQPYKPGGVGPGTHNANFGAQQWGEYSHIWVTEDWQPGVKFVRPDFLENYPTTTGHWDIQDFTFEEVTEVVTAATTASWTGVTGAGKPSDNASSNIVLVNEQNMVIVGNKATKVAGATGWNASVRSKNSYAGGAYASAVADQANAFIMFGLNTAPDLTDATYLTLDHAVYLQADGNVEVYESGVPSGLLTTYVAGDVFAVTYDGSNVRYLKNGAVFRGPIPANISAPLFFDSSFYTVGSSLSGIELGPMSSIVHPIRDINAERSTDRPPSWYPVGTTKEFKASSAVGLGGADTYLTLETVIQYKDSSGGSAYQYAYRGITTWRRWGTCGAASWAGAWVQDLDRNSYTGELNATYGAQAGVNLGDSAGNLLTDAAIRNNVDGIIQSPGGGLLITASGTLTGAIKVRLPQGYTNTMIRFTVDIYEYAAGYSCSLEIGGYTYAANSSWINVSAVVRGGNVEYPVYFGHDSNGYCSVWIGALGTTWEYPQVRVSNVLVGYSNYSRTQWESGWQVAIENSWYAHTGATVTDTYPGANWSKVTGGNRPADNATVGATFGVNIGGQITAGNASTYIANAAIGSAQIANASIGNAHIGTAAIGATQIGTAAIQAAHIGNAQVDTLSIAGNAVTIPVASTGAGYSASCVVGISAASPIVIIATFNGAYIAGATFKIFRNGVEILSTTANSSGGVTPYFPVTTSTIDNPGAGTWTYTMYSNQTVNQSFMFAMAAKR